MTERFPWLAPMALWPFARPLMPPQTLRPQGGGATRIDDESMFAAVVFVLVTGSAWRGLPRVFGVSWQTAHRRFGEWERAGLWARLRTAVVDAGGSRECLRWADVLVEAAVVRDAEARGGPATDPATGNAGRASQEAPAQRHAIRRHLSKDFVERMFGSRRDR